MAMRRSFQLRLTAAGDAVRDRHDNGEDVIIGAYQYDDGQADTLWLRQV